MREAMRALARNLRRMFGIPDYDAYCAHRRQYHPGEPVLDRSAFVRVHQDHRFGAARGPTRCC